mmetsp:Transcript_27269/g.85967  ORF Transcript_27269/g.85967 Transcript_27269/m.85967 type:complete len:206 (+) Transcript_27269:179-796(+)
MWKNANAYLPMLQFTSFATGAAPSWAALFPVPATGVGNVSFCRSAHNAARKPMPRAEDFSSPYSCAKRHLSLWRQFPCMLKRHILVLPMANLREGRNGIWTSLSVTGVDSMSVPPAGLWRYSPTLNASLASPKRELRESAWLANTILAESVDDPGVVVNCSTYVEGVYTEPALPPREGTGETSSHFPPSAASALWETKGLNSWRR